MRTTQRAAFYIGKGGVGKKTLAGHIATAAATDHHLDVVLLDLAGTQKDVATQFRLGDEVADPDAPIPAVFGETGILSSRTSPTSIIGCSTRLAKDRISFRSTPD
jgi:Mrp family chromosome partitioning ATPase